MPAVSPNTGFTLIEVLISLAVFSICIIGLSQSQRYATELAHRSEMKDRALLVAEDLYEEMLSVPFSGRTGSQNDAPRPARLGNLIAYNNFLDSPVHDVIGEAAPWGQGLARKVTVRTFTPGDRANALPPLTAPTGEYTECKIDVYDISSNELLDQIQFIRAL